MTITKNKLSVSVSEHAIEQFNLRFGTAVNMSESFIRSKQATLQNSIKFGKVISERVFAKIKYTPSQSLYINTFTDQVFVVDYHTSTIITTYKLSEAKSHYEL